MKNKTVGMVLLCTAALCTTVDLAVHKLAIAFHAGMVYLGGKGGSFPQQPAISSAVLIIVALLAFLGVLFLFKYDQDSNG